MAHSALPVGAATDWRGIVSRYQRSSPARAMTQVATTIIPLAAVFSAMFRALDVSYWITLLLALPAAGLLVRTFIIMHDCAHGSFLPWKPANEILGAITGVLTLTPFSRWRHDHALHHASSGDLDRRGHGDVPTITVREYIELSPAARRRYRFMRSPFVLFGLGPLHFIITNRLSPRHGPSMKRQRASVWSTNVAIAAVILAASFWIGWRAVVLVYGPAMYLAAAGGIWLFYVQHQFEETYWQDHGAWDYATAAMRGSSYLKLPAVLHWFTGSIGLHHVHHLGPKIPNYTLKRCHDENAVFHGVTVITIAQTMHALHLTLWDETRQRLVGFDDVVIPDPSRPADEPSLDAGY